jgi:hypothetical protein
VLQDEALACPNAPEVLLRLLIAVDHRCQQAGVYTTEAGEHLGV